MLRNFNRPCEHAFAVAGNCCPRDCPCESILTATTQRSRKRSSFDVTFVLTCDLSKKYVTYSFTVERNRRSVRPLALRLCFRRVMKFVFLRDILLDARKLSVFDLPRSVAAFTLPIVFVFVARVFESQRHSEYLARVPFARGPSPLVLTFDRPLSRLLFITKDGELVALRLASFSRARCDLADSNRLQPFRIGWLFALLEIAMEPGLFPPYPHAPHLAHSLVRETTNFCIRATKTPFGWVERRTSSLGGSRPSTSLFDWALRSRNARGNATAVANPPPLPPRPLAKSS